MTERPHDEHPGSLGDLPGGDRPDPLAPSDPAVPGEPSEPAATVPTHEPTQPVAATEPTEGIPMTTTETTELPAGAAATPPGGRPPTTPFRVEPSTPVPDDVVRDEAPAPAPSAPSGYPPAPSPAWQPRPGGPALVTVRKGPRPGAILLGLASLVVAAYVLLTNVAGAALDVRLLAPTTFGIFGAVLVLVGLAGVLSGRRR